jgi:Lon protease-like protein
MSADFPSDIFQLPLFPLNHVLFPFAPIQLYIFEERYKSMINHCIEQNDPFGVVLIREGEEVGAPATPHEIGCLARILAVKRLADGRLYLWAAGESRFRLLDYRQAEQPYLIGQVETVEDRPTDPDLLNEQMRELSRLFLHYLTLMAQQANLQMQDFPLPEEPAPLTFAVAAVGSFPQEVKQQILEMTDPNERIRVEAQWLREEIASLEAQGLGTGAQSSAGTEPTPPTLYARVLRADSEAVQMYRLLGKN